MDICIRGILILAILIFLIIINPAIAAISFGIFGLLYVILFGFVKSRLTRYGKELGDSNLLRHKTTAEAFGGIKDIKILEKESFFINSYSVEAKRFASTQAAYQMLSMIPGQAMQSLAVGFAIAMIVVLLGISGSLAAIFPMLAIYAFAIIRLMPNVQCCFSNAASLRYYSYIINSLYTDMVTLSSPPDDQAMNVMPEILPFSHQIALKGIEFSYPDSHEPVLKGIDLLIAKNMTIGLVGTTGCGKTTLVDAIMGLLEPTTGSIVVDTIPVITTPVDTGKKETIASWKRNFGYVPQYIYLRDDTITANIAFGIPEGMQDKDAVKRAAQIANIHEFIMTELPKGYNTIVGERGVRLSGGQRQRIGIARSLYHDPEILVMDEATSALDSITEEAVMDAIHKLKHLKTIIIIAHRLSTVRECDMICFMEKGRIIARGCYEELLKKNEQFRTMAKVVVK
ncbi:hypothetical protein FACS1894137_16840 [Spirochaetia bacterium]|nr:hypothetical protein FACS1894137_16840 [Spirochaetia bacterium]